ncbi:type IV pilus modification PilV family protein [Inquilinus limosus]|uniref:type IV pilus modification PilV family protein n=1 Tax=Inquilinus limosus TaxID=171674 RepID=UPI00069195D0|nr:type II secretion system protein [Inquilinus limosus]
MAHEPRIRERGFTLIEVVVALTILGLILTVIFRIFGTGMTGMARADGLQRAAIVAEGLAAQLDSLPTPLKLGSTLSGETDDGYRWRIVADSWDQAPRQTVALGARQARLARLRIAVEPRSGPRFEMTTLALVAVQ